MRTYDLMKEKLFQDKMIKNVSWTFLAKAVAMLFFFLTDIISARRLNVEQYGEWNYFFSIKTMIAYLGYLGVDQGTKIVISKIENERERAFCCKVGLIIRTIISLLLVVLIFLTAKSWTHSLNMDAKYHYVAQIFMFSGILALFNAFQEFFKEVGFGIRKNEIVFFVTLSEYGTIFVCICIFLLISPNIYSMLIGYIVAGCITLTFSLTYIKRKIFLFPTEWKNDRAKTYGKMILKYAMPLLLANIANLVSMELDTAMIGLMSTSTEVAMYNIGKKICMKAGHINLAIAGGTMATFAVINKDNYKEKVETLKRIMIVDVLITILVGAGLLLVSNIGIPILYGNNYRGAISITNNLIPFYLMFGISSCLALFLDFRNKSTMRSVVSIICVVMNIILNAIFVPRYGAKGAVLTTVFTQIPYFLFTIIVSAREIYKLKISNEPINKYTKI